MGDPRDLHSCPTRRSADLGYGLKRRAGTAEAGGGRRGARNALANAGVATLCALLAALTSLDAFAAAFVASLGAAFDDRSEEHTSELKSRQYIVCRLLLEKK